MTKPLIIFVFSPDDFDSARVYKDFQSLDLLEDDLTGSFQRTGSTDRIIPINVKKPGLKDSLIKGVGNHTLPFIIIKDNLKPTLTIKTGVEMYEWIASIKEGRTKYIESHLSAKTSATPIRDDYVAPEAPAGFPGLSLPEPDDPENLPPPRNADEARERQAMLKAKYDAKRPPKTRDEIVSSTLTDIDQL